MKFFRTTPLLLSLFAAPVIANDYPTLERVDSVLTCMKQNGGQNIENLYACSCEIDVIASMVPFEMWDEARTFEQFRGLPGEKGGIFRDSDRADEVVPQLEKARAEAKKRCFVGHSRKVKEEVKE